MNFDDKTPVTVNARPPRDALSLRHFSAGVAVGGATALLGLLAAMLFGGCAPTQKPAPKLGASLIFPGGGSSSSGGGLTDTELRATPVPVSGTVTATPTGTQTVAGALTNNNAAPAATNVGVLGAVANAADPSWTETRLVTMSVDLAGYQRVSAKQNGTWTVAGTGTFLVGDGSGALTVDGTVGATQSGSWSLAANQSVNVAQINGVTPLMGNGVTGTGSQRVTIASDNTAFTVNAAQSGTWTVQPGNTANTTPWLTSSGVAHDGVATSRDPHLIGGYASAAAPTDVSADGDAVRWWVLRSGAGVVQPTFAGVLATTGVGATGTGTQRVSSNVAIAGVEPVAHDAVISGDAVPLTISGYAETAEDSDGNTNANRVSADGDKVRLLADRNGALYVRNGPPYRWSYHENSSSALTDTTVHASCGTGLYNYIESITFSTNSATAASLMVEDSTTATILGPYYLEAVAGRGMSVVYPGGKKQTNSATLISVTTTGAIAHGIDITGFCAP